MLEPFGVTLFCDDVREEKGGKRTYVGVHGRLLRISSARPAILPRLCIVSHIVVPSGFAFESFRHELVLYRGDVEIEMLGEGVHEAPSSARSPEKGLKAVAGMEIVPLEVRDDCELRVRAVFGDLVIDLGALTVRFAEPEAEPDEPKPA
jgi:hypothetical protein